MLKIKDTIDNLIESVPDGTSRRFNCPICKGENSFSITKLGSEVKYNCFRNSCDSNKSRGILTLKPTMTGLKTRLEGRTEEKRTFTIPDYWVMGVASEKCLQMLLKTNCFEAYTKGLFKCAYDPQEDRLVYLVQDDKGNAVGAIGRSLSGKWPKNKNYHGSLPIPFTVGSGNRVVLVEDCASACAVNCISNATGLALLGTNLPESFIPYLVKYDTILVALDYDARKKALDIKNRLTYYCKNVRVVILGKDLKDMTKEEIQTCLH